MGNQKRPEVLTQAEVAARLGVNIKSVYRAVALKQIPTIRIGRRVLIPAAAFERMVRGDQQVA